MALAFMSDRVQPPFYLRLSSFAGAILLLLAAACAPWFTSSRPAAFFRRGAAAPRFYTFDLIREYTHDPDAFTQGLLYGGNDTLFESTGLCNRSTVRKVELRTGKVLVQQQIDEKMFGEGLTLLGNRLYQVTWLKNIGFIYDREDLSKREIFTHEMSDGWGLATNGKVLFGSDGTSKLYHIDPKSIEVRKTVTVKYNNNEVPFLNELEYVNDEVWANVFPTDCIARVSPDDGTVVGWIFLHDLKRQLGSSWSKDAVLNGIAWDEENRRLFVTGKFWPKLYEIKLRTVDSPPDGSVEKSCPKFQLRNVPRDACP